VFGLVTLQYARPLEEVLLHVEDHRAYLRELHRQGHLVASGPFVPRTGGALLLHAATEEAMRELIKGDPFAIRGIATYELRIWDPVIGKEALLAALPPSAGE
jgi:uncharacterized protein YciI